MIQFVNMPVNIRFNIPQLWVVNFWGFINVWYQRCAVTTTISDIDFELEEIMTHLFTRSFYTAICKLSVLKSPSQNVYRSEISLGVDTKEWRIVLCWLYNGMSVYFLMVLFCLQGDNIVHTYKTYEMTNDLTYNMLKSVAKCGNCFYFSWPTHIHW